MSSAPTDRHQIVPLSGCTTDPGILAHVQQHIGPVHGLLRPQQEQPVPVDLLWVTPSTSKPFHTLVSAGMSSRAMTLPPGAQGCQFIELCLCLPADWKISADGFADDNYYWPIRWLSLLAQLPHRHRAWLGHGHTVPNGEPPAPFAPNTKLCGMVLLPPVLLGPHFHTLNLPTKSVEVYTLVPLYAKELKVKAKKGVEALFGGFDKMGVNDIVRPNRPLTVRPKWLGMV